MYHFFILEDKKQILKEIFNISILEKYFNKKQIKKIKLKILKEKSSL